MGLPGGVVLETLLVNWQIVFVLTLIALMLTAFVTEVFPIEITALAVLALLGLSGILSIEEVLSGFSSHATITVLMMFILSAAVVQSGMIDWLGDRMGSLMGGTTARHVIVIGLVAGPISAFINNTAAVAVMIPLVIHLSNQLGDSPSQLLIPLSFAAMLGGVMTVIGTSTNLLASTLRADAGLGHFGIFEFTQAGAVIFAVGLLYLALVAPRLMPERVKARKPDEKYQFRSFLFEVEVPEKSSLINKRVGRAELTRDYGAQILYVQRGKKRLDPSDHPVYYLGGDQVVLRASRFTLQKIMDRGIVRLKTATGTLNMEKEDLELREFLVTSTSTSRGKRLDSLRFWQVHHLRPVALLTHGRMKPTELHDHRLRTGDIVLAAGPKQEIPHVTGEDVFYVLGGPEPPLRRPHKVPHVLLILMGVVGLAAAGVFPIVYTATAGAVLAVMTGALRLSDMYDSIRWDVIFLLAGVIPLGVALQSSGTAALVGQAVANSAHVLPPILLLGLFYVSVSILTEVISNNASVVLMIPIGLEIAGTLGYNPTTFILGAMFAASTSFLSPVGYQTNLMVMGPGGYRYIDYLRIGGPLNLIMAIITPLVLNSFWPLV